MVKSNYWCNSKFADFIRGSKKLSSGTSLEWAEWEANQEKNNKFRYWLSDTALDKLQDIVFFIPNIIDSALYYIRKRFIDQSHVCKTGFKPGSYNDIPEKILFGMFTQVEELVENEKAWMEYLWSDENKYNDLLPFYKKIWPLSKLFRFKNPELGLKYLNWESKLANPETSELTPQALAAIEIMELYNWWKNIRPNREDPYILANWEDAFPSSESLFSIKFDGEDRIKKDRALKIVRETEDQYLKEDDEMLIRLVKVRHYMWT